MILCETTANKKQKRPVSPSLCSNAVICAIWAIQSWPCVHGSYWKCISRKERCFINHTTQIKSLYFLFQFIYLLHIKSHLTQYCSTKICTVWRRKEAKKRRSSMTNSLYSKQIKATLRINDQKNDHIVTSRTKCQFW